MTTSNKVIEKQLKPMMRFTATQIVYKAGGRDHCSNDNFDMQVQQGATNI